MRAAALARPAAEARSAAAVARRRAAARSGALAWRPSSRRPPRRPASQSAIHPRAQAEAQAAAASPAVDQPAAAFPPTPAPESSGAPSPLCCGERPLAGHPGVLEGWWEWEEGRHIRYLRCGSSGPALLLVHGFCASADHWRHNVEPLGRHCRVWAVDLMGYGLSDKPCPLGRPAHSLYSIPNWGRQLRDFIADVVGEPVLLVGNSVGGLIALQAAVDDPSLVRAVQVIDVSLRAQCRAKQPPWLRPLFSAVQHLLRDTPLGRWYFKRLAQKNVVKDILCQCYANPAAVSEELVEAVQGPALQPGAADVFLDCICYSEGPVPEELLQAVQVPVSILWGEKDPWERLELGRRLAAYPTVEEFVVLPGAGHCPQDEAPELVNPLVLAFVRRHAKD